MHPVRYSGRAAKRQLRRLHEMPVHFSSPWQGCGLDCVGTAHALAIVNGAPLSTSRLSGPPTWDEQQGSSSPVLGQVDEALHDSRIQGHSQWPDRGNVSMSAKTPRNGVDTVRMAQSTGKWAASQRLGCGHSARSGPWCRWQWVGSGLAMATGAWADASSAPKASKCEGWKSWLLHRQSSSCIRCSLRLARRKEPQS